MPERIRKANLEAARFNNPISDWMLQNLVPDPHAKTKVGTKEEFRGPESELLFRNSDLWLYPNYLTWCQGSGREKVTTQRFSSTLIDAAATYGVAVSKHRDNNGVKIQGLRIRAEFEENWLTAIESEDPIQPVKTSVKDNPLNMQEMKTVKALSTSAYREKGYMPPSADTSTYVEVEL